MKKIILALLILDIFLVYQIQKHIYIIYVNKNKTGEQIMAIPIVAALVAEFAKNEISKMMKPKEPNQLDFSKVLGMDKFGQEKKQETQPITDNENTLANFKQKYLS